MQKQPIAINNDFFIILAEKAKDNQFESTLTEPIQLRLVSLFYSQAI